MKRRLKLISILVFITLCFSGCAQTATISDSSGNLLQSSSASEIKSSVSEIQSSSASVSEVQSSSSSTNELNLTNSFVDEFTPVQGSTAIKTTPMDPSSVSQAVQGKTLLTVNRLFSDYAILQRKAAVPVWGTGVNGKTVKVKFAGQTKTTVVASGRWRINLDPMEASTQNRQMVISCDDTVLVVNNILVGEVWLAGGQSNMAMSLFNITLDLKRQLLKETGNDSLREFLVTIEASESPKTDPVGSWTPADTSKNIVSISTVAYYYAKQLQKALGVPVGIVRSAVSATELELWVDTTKVEARNFTNPGKPLKKATHYKAMIQPLFPFAIKGMIWYQGEDNCVSELTYASYQNIFSVLLENYRTGFENPNMPVIQVMLPKYIHQNEDAWIHFRYVQMKMQDTLKNVFTAVTIDTGDANDIHPKTDKSIVTARMAGIALNQVYGGNEFSLSPVYQSAKVSGEKVTLLFKNVSHGLTIRGAVSDLEVCGTDGKWHAATATVGKDGKSLIVTAPGVTPTGVRYANVSVPSPSLYDNNGLPVAPFYIEKF